ncbi:hypothetical protein ACNKHV_14805 [Shigella flexneri]
MVALETVFGDFHRGSPGRRAAPPRQSRRQFSRLSPRLMLISAWAMSASRPVKDRLAKSGRNATGNNGDFSAMEAASFFSARINSLNASIFVGSGQKNGFCSTCYESLIPADVADLGVRQPRISIPNFSARYFLA